MCRQSTEAFESRFPMTGSAEPTPSCGSGLLGLRDRVDALGGTISLASASSGTTLLVELPMTPE
jgi:signal transduction histidine kinase